MTTDTEILFTPEENEFRVDFRKDLAGDMILNLPLLCTICEIHMEHQLITFRNFHSFLGVLVCNRCYEICEKALKPSDREGMNSLCLWCAKRAPRRYSQHTHSGRTFQKCGACSRQFCTECIMRHAPETLLLNGDNNNSDDWICFKCNSRPLWSLRALCDLVFSWKWMPSTGNEQTVSQKNAIIDESKKCVICFEREAFVAFYPCGHLRVCETCLQEYKKTYKICPTCMQPYQDTLRIYFE